MGELMEMFALLVCATIGSRSVTVRTGVSWTRRLARWMSGRAASSERDAGEISARAERLATLTGQVIPRANCLDKAMAARIWLARRRVDASLVVGVRKRSGRPWEGHAWLERADGTPLFLEPGDAWRPTFSEEEL